MDSPNGSDHMIETNPLNACEDPMITSPSAVIVLETVTSVEPPGPVRKTWTIDGIPMRWTALGTVMVNAPSTPAHCEGVKDITYGDSSERCRIVGISAIPA